MSKKQNTVKETKDFISKLDEFLASFEYLNVDDIKRSESLDKLTIEDIECYIRDFMDSNLNSFVEYEESILYVTEKLDVKIIEYLTSKKIKVALLEYLCEDKSYSQNRVYYYIDLENEALVINNSSDPLYYRDEGCWVESLISELGCKHPDRVLTAIFECSVKANINDIEIIKTKEYIIDVDENDNEDYSIYELIEVIDYLNHDKYMDHRIKLLARDLKTDKIYILIKNVSRIQGSSDYTIQKVDINTNVLKADWLLFSKKIAFLNNDGKIIGSIDPRLSINEIANQFFDLDKKELSRINKIASLKRLEEKNERNKEFIKRRLEPDNEHPNDAYCPKCHKYLESEELMIDNSSMFKNTIICKKCKSQVRIS